MRAGRVLVAAAGPVLLLSFGVGAAALWAAALVSALLPVALLASSGPGRGVEPGRRIGLAEGVALAATSLALAGGWVVLLAFPQGGPSLPWAFGLPLGTAVMLFVMVPVPYVTLAWASARSPRRGLTEEDLARLRGLAAGRLEEEG